MSNSRASSLIENSARSVSMVVFILILADVLARVPVPRGSRARHHRGSGAGRSLAVDAAAVPARPHQSLAARGRWRLDHRGYRDWERRDPLSLGKTPRKKKID